MGVGLTLLSWLVFGIAASTLVGLQSSRWGAVVYGGTLVVEVLVVAYLVFRYRTSSAHMMTALVVAVWTCAVVNFLVLTLYPAVL